ncbi:MAG: L,D-transpeptidase [Solirubrobacteraceae bacterium]
MGGRIAPAIALAVCACIGQAAPAVAQAPAPPPAGPALATAPPTTLQSGDVLPAGQPVPALKPGDILRMSNEMTITRWAYARLRSHIYSKPSGGSRSVGRVRYYSTSGANEIYGVLNVTVDQLHRRWLRIRVPYRPNGRTGWVLSSALGPLRVARKALVVERGKLSSTLYDDGKQVFTTRVAIGRRGTPTPSGTYFVSALVRGARFGPAYGAWTFLTTAYSRRLDWPGGGLVGVHGTNQPALVPGRPSNGCIRMRNESIKKLARLMPVGTPVHIL